MLIFPKNNFIFVHIPKNGGSSFKAALKNGASQHIEYRDPRHGFDCCHLTIEQISRWCPRLWQDINSENTFSLAIVRNPFFRAKSAYKWFIEQMGHYMSFESYLYTSMLLSEWDHRFVHAVPQYRFVYSGRRKIVKSVVKLENLNDELPQIASRLACNDIILNEIPRINVSSADVTVELESEKTRNLILKNYKLDFELFDYNKKM